MIIPGLSWTASGSSTPRQSAHSLGKPSFPEISSWPKTKWLSDQVPELPSLLGPDRWLLFNKLGLGDEDLELQLDPNTWNIMPGSGSGTLLGR